MNGRRLRIFCGNGRMDRNSHHTQSTMNGEPEATDGADGSWFRPDAAEVARL